MRTNNNEWSKELQHLNCVYCAALPRQTINHFSTVLSISMTSIQSIERYLATVSSSILSICLFLSQTAIMQSTMTHAVVTLNHRNNKKTACELNYFCFEQLFIRLSWNVMRWRRSFIKDHFNEFPSFVFVDSQRKRKAALFCCCCSCAAVTNCMYNGHNLLPTNHSITQKKIERKKLYIHQ